MSPVAIVRSFPDQHRLLHASAPARVGALMTMVLLTDARILADIAAERGGELTRGPASGVTTYNFSCARSQLLVLGAR